MYQKKLSRGFSQIAVSLSSIAAATPTGSFPNTKEVLISRLASVVKACKDQPECVHQGQQLHAQIILNGIDHHDLLGTRILGMYILCGKYADATNMFHQLDLVYASPWNWMIRGFTAIGSFRLALLFYFKMLAYGVSPDRYTFPYLIKACGGLRVAGFVRSVLHGTVRLMGFETDVYVATSLIKVYTENGFVDDARYLFDKLPNRDSVLWNVMLNGYAKVGDSGNVIELFGRLRTCDIGPNSVTYACALSACASGGIIRLGTQLHGLVVRCGLETDPPVLNSLIALYAKCQRLRDARQLFGSVQETDLVAWNSIISGHVQNGFMLEAYDILRQMISSEVKPDTITLASFLPAVPEAANVNHCKEIHCHILRHGVPLDVFLSNALIDTYFKCGDVGMARSVFHCCSAIDVVICTAMVSGYVLNGMNVEALEVFRWSIREQLRPNAVTLSSCLPACADLVALKQGKELHCNILKNGLEGKCYVGTAAMDMYAKCGRLDLARRVFLKMPEKDAVSWNSMITSLSQNGEPGEAIYLFRQMGRKGVEYDSVSISAAISACSNVPCIRYGKEIHGFITRGVVKVDICAESALIDMYAKCGNLESARRVFDVMQEKNEVSWNSIIAAYGNHSQLTECLSLFREMKERGFNPDHVTFLAILSACDHADRVDEGNYYFKIMTEDYRIQARMEHYACLIDLFGRAGRLREAFEIIRSMPFDPDAGIWGTLLGASKLHGNVELAEVASRHLFEMDPNNSGYFVLLSNVQADAGKWEGVHRTRSMMKHRGVEKVPGYSWIEQSDVTHIFVAADTSHPQSDKIYVSLRNILLGITEEEYMPNIPL